MYNLTRITDPVVWENLLNEIESDVILNSGINTDINGDYRFLIFLENNINVCLVRISSDVKEVLSLDFFSFNSKLTTDPSFIHYIQKVLDEIFVQRKFNIAISYILSRDKTTLELVEKIGFKQTASLRDHYIVNGRFEPINIYVFNEGVNGN